MWGDPPIILRRTNLYTFARLTRLRANRAAFPSPFFTNIGRFHCKLIEEKGQERRKILIITLNYHLSSDYYTNVLTLKNS